MKLRYLLIALALALISASGWVYVTFTVRSTQDGYMFLYEKQANECKEGGGCQIVSEREFMAAMNYVLRRQRREPTT